MEYNVLLTKAFEYFQLYHSRLRPCNFADSLHFKLMFRLTLSEDFLVKNLWSA